MERVSFWTTILTIIGAAIVVYGFGCGEDECAEDLFTPQALAAKTIIVGLIILFFALYNSRKIAGNESIVYRVDRYPSTKIKFLTAGVPASTSGYVVADSKLIAPYSQQECVYYHSITEEYVSSDDSSYWRVIENIAEYVPFRIDDRETEIEVDLHDIYDDLSGYRINALKAANIIGEECKRKIKLRHVPSQKNSEIDCIKVMYQKYFGSIIRKTEYILPPETKVFAYGIVGKRKDGKLYIHNSETEQLIISKRTKEEYVEDFFGGRTNRAIYWSSFLISLGLIVIYLGLNFFFGISLIFLLLAQSGVFFFLFFRVYNRIVVLYQRGRDALSHIDIQLKRRADVIPSLVVVVKQYATYEKKLFEDIARLRAEPLTTSTASKGAELYENNTKQLKGLFAVVENYPDLKASQSFKKLAGSLIDAEERIAYSRSFYNRTVEKYNTLISTFPGFVYAAIFRFRNMQFFRFEE